MNKKFIFTFLLPLAISSTSFVCSCNKVEIIETHIRDGFVGNPLYRATAPVITATEFNKTFSHGDIIEMTIHLSDKDYDIVFPYVTEYAEAGYYGSCLCDESDGTHKGNPDYDYVNISYAMHPYSSKAESFFNAPATFKMYKKAGFKEKMESVNCSEKLELNQLGNDVLAYANFRDVNNVGNFGKIIKPGVLYRGASPIYSKTSASKRYLYSNSLLEYYKIDLDICLNDNYLKVDSQGNISGVAKNIKAFKEEKINDYIVKRFEGVNDKSSEYSTYEEKNSYMCCVPLSTDFYSTSTSKSSNYLYMCGKVFDSIANKVDPEDPSSKLNTFYIHCEEGKDRTGFIMAALEAYLTPNDSTSNDYLEDIVADFMLSYKNYFNITLAQDINRYQEIADLTIYRHLYGLCLDDASVDFKKEDFNWLAVDSKKKVKELLNETQHLHYHADKYIKKALKEFYTFDHKEASESEVRTYIENTLININEKLKAE